MRKIYILLLIMTILISPVTGEENQSINNATYRVYVDQYHGFYAIYRVYNVTSAKVVPYENNTLNISRGDTVIWSNEAVPDTKLTIANKENLWDWHDGQLLWSYKKFIYNFNRSGIYKIYVKEYPRFNQTIRVLPLETNNTNKTVNQTNVTKSNLAVNNTNKTKINTSVNVSANKTTVPVPSEKKQGTEAIVLITVTLSLIYIFDRKIK